KQGGSQAFSAAMPAMLGSTAAIGLGVAAAVRFDDAISKIGTALGKTEFGRVRGELEGLAKTLAMDFGESTADAAAALELLVKSGVAIGDLKYAAAPIMAAAKADGMATDAAAQIVISTINQFGMSMDQAGRTANALSKAADESGASIASIGEGMTYAGASAHRMGFDVEQTTAALSLLDKFGSKGSVGGTGLAAVLDSLTSPRKAKHFAELGVAVTDSTGKLRPFMSIVSDTQAALSRIPNEAKRLQKTQLLFGEQGSRALAGLAGAGTQAFDTMVDKVRNGTTTVQDKADIMASSLGGVAKRIKSTFEVIAIDMAQSFGAGGKSGLQGVLKLAQDVQKAFATITAGGDMSALMKIDPTAVAIAQGMKAAIDGVKQAFRDIKPHVMAFLKTLTPDKVAAWTKAALIFAALSPPLLVLLPLLSSGITLIGGLGKVLFGAGTAGSGLVGFFLNMKKLIGPATAAMWKYAAATLAASRGYGNKGGLIGPALPPGMAGKGPGVAGYAGMAGLALTAGALVGAGLDAYGESQIAAAVKANLKKGEAVDPNGLIAAAPRPRPLPNVAQYRGPMDEASILAAMRRGAPQTQAAQSIATASEEVSVGGLTPILRQLSAASGLVSSISTASATTVQAAADAADLAARIDSRASMSLHDSLVAELEYAEQVAERMRKTFVTDIADAVGDAFAMYETKAAAARAEIEAKPVHVTTNVKLDSKNVGRGIAKAQLELKDRTGSKTTPVQRRMILERGIGG
ncbi:phage tail tape measure protein, partial [Zavarzinia sp.]|uniref:phage tail tape measure protein n=1 Tax=Zavarzinia sp. TaxID=2027920 RepID=UPI00356A724E